MKFLTIIFPFLLTACGLNLGKASFNAKNEKNRSKPEELISKKTLNGQLAKVEEPLLKPTPDPGPKNGTESRTRANAGP